MNSILQHTLTKEQDLIAARIKMQGDSSHCLEVVRESKDVVWINHSIATTTDLTWLALRDVPGPVVLIMGGTDRADDHRKLSELINEKVCAVVCLGTTPWKYVEAFGGNAHLIIRATYIEEAVRTARRLCNDDVKTVLFSPGCPSYDAFDNYRNRGNSFRDAVSAEFNNSI